MFKWTDTCLVEEIEVLIEKVDDIERATQTLQKGLNICDSDISTLKKETRLDDSVLQKDIEDLKTQIRCLKNIVVFAILFVLFFYFF